MKYLLLLIVAAAIMYMLMTKQKSGYDIHVPDTLVSKMKSIIDIILGPGTPKTASVKSHYEQE
jgi:hypothetical protein